MKKYAGFHYLQLDELNLKFLTNLNLWSYLDKILAILLLGNLTIKDKSIITKCLHNLLQQSIIYIYRNFPFKVVSIYRELGLFSLYFDRYSSLRLCGISTLSRDKQHY